MLKRIILNRKKSKELIGLFLALFFAVFLVVRIYSAKPGIYQLKIEGYASQKSGICQVFYDIGSGFNETHSVRSKGFRTDGISTVSVQIPIKNINALRHIRIDPGNQPGIISIKSISLEYISFLTGDSYSDIQIKPSEIKKYFVSSAHIDRFEAVDNQLKIVSSGEDPYFVSNDRFNHVFLHQDAFESRLKRHSRIAVSLKSALILFILMLVLIVYLKRKRIEDFYNHYFDPIFQLILKGAQKYLYEDKRETKEEKNRKTVSLVLNFCILLVFIWFLFQVVFFATKIKYGIAPDETHHFWLNRTFFQTEGIFLKDSPKTYSHGTVSTIPYLYHLILGKLLRFNLLDISPLIFWRSINVLLSFSYFVFAYLLIREITSNKIIQLCSLVIQSNILMFVFLSGMISYDNMVNLVGAVSLFLLLRFLKTYSRLYLFLLLTTMMVGGLVKITYLPLILIQLAVFVPFSIKIYQNRHIILFRPLLKIEWLLFPLMFVLLLLCLKLYLGNIVTYGSIFPSADKVISQEKALKYYAQSRVVKQMKKTRVQREKMSFPRFVKSYYYRAQSVIFGIMGHKNLPKAKKDLKNYNYILLVYLLIAMISLKFILKDYQLLILFGISAAYIVVVFFVNYYAYSIHHVFGAALQGRYNFVVLAGAASFFAYTYLFRFNDKVKTLLTLLLAAVFVPGGFFYFLTKAGLDWYR